MSERLGQSWRRGVPIEVLPSAYRLVQETIERKLGGRAALRESNPQSKAVIVSTKQEKRKLLSFFFHSPFSHEQFKGPRYN